MSSMRRLIEREKGEHMPIERIDHGPSVILRYPEGSGGFNVATRSFGVPQDDIGRSFCFDDLRSVIQE